MVVIWRKKTFLRDFMEEGSGGDRARDSDGGGGGRVWIFRYGLETVT